MAIRPEETFQVAAVPAVQADVAAKVGRRLIAMARPVVGVVVAHEGQVVEETMG